MSLILCFVLFVVFDFSVARNIHNRYTRPTTMVSHNHTFFEDIRTTVEDYPKNEILRAIRSAYNSSHKVDHFFVGLPNVYSINLERHRRSENVHRKLCESTISTKILSTLENTSKQNKYIVNNDEYKQHMRLEECLTDISTFHPKIKCVQRYQRLFLLTYDNSTFKLSYDEFNVPIICEASCVDS